MTVSNTTTRPTTNTTRTSSSDSAQQRHTVRSGENLWSIARQHSGGRTNDEVARYHQELIRANPQLKDPNVIHPGQELNLPSTAGTSTAGTSSGSRIKPATSDASRFEASSSAPPPQTARPDPNALGATHPPISQDLANEVTARRAAANTNPAGRTHGARPATAEEEEQELNAAQGGNGGADNDAGGRVPDLGPRSMPYSNVYGNNLHRQFSREGSDAGTLVSQSQTDRTQNRGAEQWRETNRDTTETSVNGQQTRQLQEEHTLRNRRTGEGELETTTVAQDQDGNFGSRTTNNALDDDRSDMDRLMEMNGPEAFSATAVLAQQRLAGDDDWHGVATVDNRHMEDRTGGGYEAHALAYRANADAAATIDLRHGEVNVGVGGAVQADLVGASASGQLGTTDSTVGALHGQAEAHVGARAEGGAGVVVNPSNIGVRAGGEAFAGAEVRGTVGYDNRYGGVSVTGRAQAGAGAAAGVDVGYRNGVVGVQADLGAAVGIGGRVTVDVSVNVGAIAEDVGKAAVNVADTVVDVAQNVGQAVGNAANNVKEGFSRAWSAINPFGN